MITYYKEGYIGNFDTTINVEYPKHNYTIFEKWLLFNFHKYEATTDRTYLPVQWTAYYVNNNYGNDKNSINRLQEWLNKCDKSLKYWTCIQYDDGILNDVSHLDLLQFNMSKKIGIEMPLICQPHPYTFSGEKKYFASFVGSRTHPIRNGIERYANKKDWYISYEPHSIEHYCEILSQSLFSICPRGYGASSFRTCEAMQYNSIPVYLSDTFIDCFDLDFDSFGVKHNAEDITTLALRLETMPDVDVSTQLNNIKEVYRNYYTYEGAMKQIIKYLENEKQS